MKEFKQVCGIQLLSTKPVENATVSYEEFHPEKLKAVKGFHQSLPFYRPTPLLSLSQLAKKLGVKAVYVKDESQRFPEFGLNAFKGMGGIYAVGQVLCRELGLVPQTTTFADLIAPEYEEKRKKMTFITTTDGNHGRGVAWAAHQYGCKSYVYMPKGSAQSRVDAVKRVGAEDCIVTDMNYDDTVAYTAKLAQEKGWYLVQDTAWEGYEQVPMDIMKSYTTIADEAFEQMKEAPTHVFLQAGVGSFAAAVMAYYAHLLEQCPQFICMEPTMVACFYHSAKVGDGQPHGVESAENTIMAGLNCGMPSISAWPIIRDLCGSYIACDDVVTEEGMRLAAYPTEGDTAFVSGESAAVGLGLVNRLLSCKELKEQAKVMGLNENSVILLFSTEGATDPIGYERVVGKGKEI